MTFKEYQSLAHMFALESVEGKFGDVVVYPVMGLAEEAGEVVGKFAKIIRDKDAQISFEAKQELAKELGDVLWFVAEISSNLGLELSAIAVGNIEKLRSRKERNKIQGEGDNR